MVHYLRTNNGENVIQTEVYGDIDNGTFDLHSSISAYGFGEKVIDIYKNIKDFTYVKRFMEDVNELDEVRGLYWEQLRYDDKINTKEDVENIIKDMYKEVAYEYDLCYVTD